MMNAALPYPGLRPYQTDESYIFFGREQHTDELLKRLARARFLAVVGPSGCGKSSLVRAGMIAGLETGFMASAGTRQRVPALAMNPVSRPAIMPARTRDDFPHPEGPTTARKRARASRFSSSSVCCSRPKKM